MNKLCKQCAKRTTKNFCAIKCYQRYWYVTTRKRKLNCIKCKFCEQLYLPKRTDNVYCSNLCSSRDYQKQNPEKRRRYRQNWEFKNKKKAEDYRKKWAKLNKEKVKAADRKAKYKKYYKMTVEQYEALLLSQANKCAICRNEENQSHYTTNKIKRLSIDHNHHTKQIRGLLCTHCNTALGLFKESVMILNNAIKYLGKYE